MHWTIHPRARRGTLDTVVAEVLLHECELEKRQFCPQAGSATVRGSGAGDRGWLRSLAWLGYKLGLKGRQAKRRKKEYKDHTSKHWHRASTDWITREIDRSPGTHPSHAFCSQSKTRKVICQLSYRVWPFHLFLACFIQLFAFHLKPQQYFFWPPGSYQHENIPILECTRSNHSVCVLLKP